MPNNPEKPTPPGSLGWPIIGETIAYVKNPHRFFETRFEKHGPVFKTRILFDNVVCFVGPEAFTFFMSEPYFGREDANPSQVRNLLYHHSLPLVDGAEHRQMRSLVMQAFRVEALETYLRIVETATLPYLRQWEDEMEFAWLPECKKLSATICDALLTSTEPRVDATDLSGTLDAFLAGLTAIPLKLPWTRYGRALRNRDRLLNIIDDAIGRHRGNSYDDMLTELLNARGDDGAQLTDLQLRSQMVHMFFAAYGGIYRVLALLCMNLAQHPDVMKRARDEVLQHTPEGPLNLEQIARLTFLDQVTREVRRHNRIFASTFFERVTRSFDFHSYHVPQGWKAVGGIYTTMQDTHAFTNPQQFDPDRFRPDRAEDRRYENSYVPHGGGSKEGHRCPGEDLTTILMKAVGVLLLRDYTWDLPPQDLDLDDAPNPLPRDGLKVRFQRFSPTEVSSGA